eukprot:1144052-Pelagomonas_calceolata.AAC.6
MLEQKNKQAEAGVLRQQPAHSGPSVHKIDIYPSAANLAAACIHATCKAVASAWSAQSHFAKLGGRKPPSRLGWKQKN